MRKKSKIAENWWDYTTLNDEILNDASRLSDKDIMQLSRPGFQIKFFETLNSFYMAEAFEYINCWKESTSGDPTGICGPIGPVEQLPLIAQLVNDLEINVRNGHFWAMDEWIVDGKEMPETNPLNFKRANLELWFNRIRKEYIMPDENLHFPRADNIDEYSKSYDEIKCLIMQGGQGDIKHWAFNDPLKREGKYMENPPEPSEYRKLKTRVVDLHPVTMMQNARTSGGGMVSSIPSQAITVGPIETWKSKKVSIWHAGNHDNPFGQRLTAFMISKKIIDSSVPMSLLADHPDVQFNFYRPGLGSCLFDLH